MLSNRGSAKLSFIVTFLIIFLICGLYCFFELESGWLSNFKSKKQSFEKTNINYEAELTNAARNYVNNYYKDIKVGERLIIKLSTLREYNYISLNGCNGYSIVKKEESLIIESYVRCSDYTSSNYNTDFE